ncbi:hypothetical protein M9Y10_006429 [Tritrichomonas musculus]|uniref:Uncharacterized protein n=1 Tax=Tritrichomonas musculus TaxID=1915356 RepID=A0ABR2JFM8_9EUKA
MGRRGNHYNRITSIIVEFNGETKIYQLDESESLIERKNKMIKKKIDENKNQKKKKSTKKKIDAEIPKDDAPNELEEGKSDENISFDDCFNNDLYFADECNYQYEEDDCFTFTNSSNISDNIDDENADFISIFY